MSIAEKKEEIIKTLQQANDEKPINEVYELLHDEETFEELEFDYRFAPALFFLNGND